MRSSQQLFNGWRQRSKFHSVIWHCQSRDRKGNRPVKHLQYITKDFLGRECSPVWSYSGKRPVKQTPHHECVCVCVNKQLYEQQVLYTFSVCDRFHVFAEVHCRLDYIKMTNWIKIINNTHTRKKHTNWYKITTPNNTEETLQNITANTKIKH